MTQEKYDKLKQAYIEFILKIINDFGGLPAAVTVLGTRKDDGENAVIHIPIPDFLLQSDQGKDKFVEEILPEISKEVKAEFDISYVAWATEAWYREIPKEQTVDGGVPENWKSLPKKEVLFITIEGNNKLDIITMEIVRNGEKVTQKGKLIDQIELVPMELPDKPDKVSGRFAGLYKTFI